MVRAHRQAWTWQDEWYGLTIEDIRKLEHEAARELSKRFANDSTNDDNPSSDVGGRELTEKVDTWDTTQSEITPRIPDDTLQVTSTITPTSHLSI
ncbi:unnamed protein product [Protopolystoma xenopodis]|uniref:Phosphatidylinositol transfer protein N-terminal domain-containing protein n=1 Tax=Protopolystoma xenopodis TaxID=117903 RepID=A0A3S5A3X0_9PLAT|nr:unnamed protein product [Protopolystoma xenopodis]